MPSPLTYNFDSSVTGQQRAWVDAAIARCRFPFPSASLTILFTTVAEPPCPGHQDYMCTTTDGGGGATVYIREGADNPSANFNAALGGSVQEVQRFFQESIIHEVVGHAFPFNHMVTNDDDRTRLAGYFKYNASAEKRTGTLADWNPLDAPWGDRIQEGLAEFLKDVYMPEQFREYDNRSNWDFDQTHFADLLTWIEETTCAEISSD